MIRIALIAAHVVARRMSLAVARLAHVPYDGRVCVHGGAWSADSDTRIVWSKTDMDYARRIDRGFLLTVACHWWEDGGAEIHLMWSANEVTGEAGARLVAEYDAEQARDYAEMVAMMTEVQAREAARGEQA